MEVSWVGWILRNHSRRKAQRFQMSCKMFLLWLVPVDTMKADVLQLRGVYLVKVGSQSQASRIP